MLVSKTFAVVTPQSAELGDIAESGFSFENSQFGFRELVKELREYPHKSESHGVPRWVTSEEDVDFESGDSTSYSLHPAKDARSQRYWEKACRAAGLIH